MCGTVPVHLFYFSFCFFVGSFVGSFDSFFLLKQNKFVTSTFMCVANTCTSTVALFYFFTHLHIPYTQVYPYTCMYVCMYVCTTVSVNMYVYVCATYMCK